MLTRRDWLVHHTVALGVLAALAPHGAHARNAAAFDATELHAALRACGVAQITPSAHVVLEAPDFEENGTVVTVRLACALAGVQRMLLLVEDNPVVLSAQFELLGAVAPDFVTRIRLAQSSAVVAVALLADGRALFARKAVTIIQGGCH